ncbi:MAG: YvcK family protein [Acidobacteria bacterium]|nr:YvcK family protein [Acidobacteriota bacterium]
MDPSLDAPQSTTWQPDVSRTGIEHLLEFLLTGVLSPNAPGDTEKLAERILRFDLRDTRAVILGGGTGLSTIVGGNSQLPNWPARSDVGIKREFESLDFVVCTTDDGGSTGRLLKFLPIIGGVGDLRKLLLSSILHENLQRKYGVRGEQIYNLVCIIHYLFNYRFTERTADFACYKNPLLLVSHNLRSACPKPLSETLSELGRYVCPGGSGPTIPPTGHALGNIFLTSAIFMAAKGRTDRPPVLREIQTGINRIAELIGASVGRIHPATATPGQLKFRYINGVEVYGQSKSALANRSSPVERITVEFTRKPAVSAAILNAIKRADLLILAPGSLYTSIIPILHLDPIVEAIRSNTRALKILGANSWVQEGETDKSFKNQRRGFLVSELIEAYGRNIRGGIEGLFDVVLSANMEQIPGNILRNYALEGKSPIHMDRFRVEAMSVTPVEATLFAPQNEHLIKLIHHDPKRFALAIRTLLYIDKFLKNKKEYRLRPPKASRKAVSGRKSGGRHSEKRRRSPLLCDYMNSIKASLKKKDIRPAELRDLLIELAWENRDLQPSHLKFFRGVRVIPAVKWNRSTELDNVLGYFDPQNRYIKLREDLLFSSSRLRQDLLVALGESLLGRYMHNRRWIKQNGSRCYEITLKPEVEQECYLTDSQLRAFLTLARLNPDPENNRIFRITINRDGGFIPPGLLFGLVYAWYLSGQGFTMEYEMTLLRWPTKSLIPLHAKDRARKEALVTFFRQEIFGHNPDK